MGSTVNKALRVTVAGCLIAFLAVSPTRGSGGVAAPEFPIPVPQPASGGTAPEDLTMRGTPSMPDAHGLASRLKPLRVVEVATGRSAEIRIFGSAAGRTAVLHFSDPQTGSMELVVDSRGTLWTDDGVSVGGDVLEAAWKGGNIPTTGVAHIFRTVRGVSEVLSVPYDSRQPVPRDPRIESSNTSGGSTALARFSEFSGHLLAAAGGGSEGRSNTSSAPAGFRIEAAASPSALLESANVTPLGDWLDCLACGFAIIGYIAATAGLVSCLTIFLCLFAILVFTAAGWEVSRECATCL